MKKKRYYRCGGYHKKICSSHTIKAELFETKIIEIICDYLHIFQFKHVENLSLSEEIKERKLKELREGKLKLLKIQPDGEMGYQYPNFYTTRFNVKFKARIGKPHDDYYIKDICKVEMEFKKIKNIPYNIEFLREEEKEMYLEEKKDLLKSDDARKINFTLEPLVRIDFSIPEKIGLIHFLSTKKEYEMKIPYYKFSIKN